MKRNGKQSVSRSFDNTTRCAFRSYFAGPAASVAAGLFLQSTQITPTTCGSRVLLLALQFEFWRLKWARIRIVLSGLGNGGQQMYLAFTPVGPAMFGTPTTVQELVDCPHFVTGGSQPSVLALPQITSRGLDSFGNNKTRWFVTNTTGVTDTLLFSPGTIIGGLGTVSSDITSKTWILLEGEVELRCPVDPVLSIRLLRESKLLAGPVLSSEEEKDDNIVVVDRDELKVPVLKRVVRSDTSLQSRH